MQTSALQDRLYSVECVEEKIRINSQGSSETLKDEIRGIIFRYGLTGWDLKKMYNCGPFIYLKFGQTINLNYS